MTQAHTTQRRPPQLGGPSGPLADRGEAGLVWPCLDFQYNPPRHFDSLTGTVSKIVFRAGRSRATQTPRASDSAGAHRRTHQGAAGRALPASRGRRSVRTAAAKGKKPTICGLEALGALRRASHAAHAGKTWHIAFCWAGARVPAESSGVICVHTPLAAGALVELGAENSRMSQYGGAVN